MFEQTQEFIAESLPVKQLVCISVARFYVLMMGSVFAGAGILFPLSNVNEVIWWDIQPQTYICHISVARLDLIW